MVTKPQSRWYTQKDREHEACGNAEERAARSPGSRPVRSFSQTLATASGEGKTGSKNPQQPESGPDGNSDEEHHDWKQAAVEGWPVMDYNCSALVGQSRLELLSLVSSRPTRIGQAQ